MKIETKAFSYGAPIPQKYTCDGDNINPPLNLYDIPKETRSLALVVLDPDAPMGTFVHWIVWNIDPKYIHINEATLPVGAIQGLNSAGQNSYSGPCPPKGKHRYYFRLYAISDILDLPKTANFDDFTEAISGYEVDLAETMGTYSRSY